MSIKPEDMDTILLSASFMSDNVVQELNELLELGTYGHAVEWEKFLGTIPIGYILKWFITTKDEKKYTREFIKYDNVDIPNELYFNWYNINKDTIRCPYGTIDDINQEQNVYSRAISIIKGDLNKYRDKIDNKLREREEQKELRIKQSEEYIKNKQIDNDHPRKMMNLRDKPISRFEKEKAKVYSRGNKWEIENWEATHN